MLPLVYVETPQNDADFDLDVRLQQVQYRTSANHPPTDLDCATKNCSLIGCSTSGSACKQRMWQD